MKIYYCNAKTLLDESLFLRGMEYVDSGRRKYIWELKNPLDKARSLGCSLLYRYAWLQDIAVCSAADPDEAALYQKLMICGQMISEKKISGAEETYKDKVIAGAMTEGAADAYNIPDISIGRNGKPDVAGICSVHISFSHSGALSAAAYHIGDHPIGMDIQRMSGRKVKDHVAEYIMSETEYAEYCAAGQSCGKCAFFYRILCCKEAYTKMTGEGILADFGSLDVSEIKKKYHLYSSTIDWNGETYMLSACWNEDAEPQILFHK